MQHLAVKAAVESVTDQGIFEAIAAAWTVDRDREQIRRGAFADTIRRWQASGKQLPLHREHSAAAEDIIGSIDPHSMHELDAGLYVQGRLDLDESETAREVWRSMKAGRLGLSFGFLATETSDRGDGVKVIEAIDLFEVSVTAAPANADTRILSTKAAVAAVPTIEELQERIRALGLEDPEVTRVRGEFSRHLYELLTTPLDGKSLPSKPERPRRTTPITVKSYPVN
jgi:HK97 family phage prohead protease